MVASAAALPATATQVVYLNFERTIAADPFLPFEYDYSQAERDQIQASLEQDFGLFDFQFVQTEPTSGEFSTLLFNDGPPGGVAEGIDFRNVNKSDRARIDTYAFIDRDPSFDVEDFIELTGFVAAHELGHILGLRHFDSLGPIGSGFYDEPGYLFFEDFAINPAFTGPREADGTLNHIIETGVSQGLALTGDLPQKYLGAREAIKLSFNERGAVFAESSLAPSPGAPFPQPAVELPLPELFVPNTVELGVVGEQIWNVEAVAVTGAISTALQKDYYAFEGQVGDLINIQVISDTLGPESLGGNDRYTQVIDAVVSVFDSSGNLIPHFDGVATNLDDFEFGGDTFLLDLVLPANDTYYIEVRSQSSFDVGNYELFAYTFEAEQIQPGDYNRDGVVDMADYTVWADTNGSTTDLRADSDQNGKIDELDYEKWADNFGLIANPVITPAELQALGGSSLSVPEPGTVTTLLLAIGGTLLRRR